jgi:UDPglucose 6-dehydrogenase
MSRVSTGWCSPIGEPGGSIFRTTSWARCAARGSSSSPVGTPSRRGEDAADLAFVRAAAEQIGRAMDGFTVVVTKSTVPVGTARMLERLIRDVRPDADFEMASNPEFLREGSAVEDFLRPDRIVVGLSAARARERMSELYRPLMLRDVPVLFTTFETAELIKYAANAYLATRIGFINEMADLCEAVGADVAAVTRGMGLDRRIGLHYLQPGPGFGGSCFPKDTRALASIARQAGSRAKIVEAVIDSNNLRKESLAERIAQAVGGDVRGKRVAVLGRELQGGNRRPARGGVARRDPGAAAGGREHRGL